MRYSRLILLLLVIFFSPFSFAQSPQEHEALNVMESIFQVDPAYMKSSDSFEYQHRYLGSLFGTFIFQIWGSGDPESITPLSYAIGFVNIISMLLAIITFLYVYILGAVGTASDASLLGKENSATFIPIRTAIGFGLLMPVPGIGGGVFSTIQLLIVWVIVTGSNAATVMWNGVVDYIADNPEQVLGTEGVDKTVAYDFGKMLLCSVIVQSQFAENNRWRRDRMSLASTESANGGTQNTSISLEENTVGGFFGFGAARYYTLSEGASYVSDISGNLMTSKLSFSNGICGEVSFPVVDINSDEFEEDINLNHALISGRVIAAVMMTEVHSAVFEMSQRFETYRNVREQYTSGDGGVGDALITLSDDFRVAAENYGKGMNQTLDGHFNQQNNQEASELANRLKHGGWMNSILWFYERALYTSGRSTFINQFNNAFNFGGAPDICADVDFSDDDQREECGGQQEELFLAIKTVDTFLMESGFTDDMARRKMNNACPFGPECTSSQSQSSGQDLAQAGSELFSAKLLSSSLLGSGHDVTSTNGRLNPFTVMSDLGLTLNRNAFAAWVTLGLGRSYVAAVADTTLSIEVNTFLKGVKFLGGVTTQTIKNVITFSLMSIGPVVLGILSNGFILAYVVPFMPVLTWIAMLIGYLMMTIEAVIAAPLAVVLMFTPEGRGIVGTRLQSAINLVNACTLRPTLMTLGVLAGVQISYVAYEILNTFFWQVAQNYLAGGVFDFIAILIIYVTSCYQICKVVVSAIPRLPDQIMQWMSSGVGRAFGESEAMSNDSAAGHLSKGMSSGLNGGNTSGGIMKNVHGRSMSDIERNGPSKRSDE